MNSSLYLKSSLIYILLISIFYLLSFNFTLTSPSGIPNPLNYPYANNDFHFYRNFSLNLPISISESYKPGLIFPLLIYFFEKLIGLPYLLSPFFSLIGLAYILRLVYIIHKINPNLIKFSLLFYVLIPYNYFFIVYPSTDFLLSIIVAETIYIVYVSNKLNSHIFYKIILSLLAVMIRPNGIAVILLFILFELNYIFNSFKLKSKNLFYFKNYTLLFLQLFLLVLSIFYYFQYKDVYFDSSTIYIKERLDLIPYSNYLFELFYYSPIEKFFSSFGFRYSFQTTAPGFIKNDIFIYLRLITSFILIFAFIFLLLTIKHSRLSRIVLITYILLFICAFNGVSFERYFISIYPFILQIGLSKFFDLNKI